MVDVGGLAVDLFQGLFEHVEHPTEGPILQMRPPTRFSASPASIRRQAPTLGQHTADVLSDWLACPPERLAELQRCGAV